MNRILTVLFLIAFTVLMMLVAYQSFKVNLGTHMQFRSEGEAVWQAEQPQYLLDLAASQLETDPNSAIDIAKRVILQQPGESRAYLIIGLGRELMGINADEVMRIADRFGPRMLDNQLYLAGYWARRDDVDQTLAHWRVAIEMKHLLTRALFPQMLKLLEDPTYISAFTKLAIDRPIWWESFFHYLVAMRADENTISTLYHHRQDHGLASVAERKAYVDFLIKQYRSLEAYAEWLSSLDESALKGLGYLYDGNFDYPPSGEGFGWRFASGHGFKLNRVQVSEEKLSPALSISFYGHRLSSRQLAQQFLMLTPGLYSLDGLVRAESLLAGEGVRWAIRCADGVSIMQGEFLSGNIGWSPYQMTFTVPDPVGCEVQQIYIESVAGGKRPFDYQGVVFFDGMAIKKLENNVDLNS
jgi:hypothetical protein